MPGCSSVGRTLGLGPRGRQFKSGHPDKAFRAGDREIASSNLAIPTHVSSVSVCMPPKFIKYKRAIDGYLQTLLSEYALRLSCINRWGGDIVDRLSTFVSNGKTIRGGLVLFAAEAYGKKGSADALRVACALEVIHSGLLIHDDIIDQDRTRRNARTLYVQYEDLATELKIENRIPFGRGMAICIGDVTFFLAIELISTLADKNNSQVIMHTLSQEYIFVCLAQMQDVAFGFSRTIPTEADILSVYRYKTARYTFSMPLMVGAMLAGAPKAEIQVLEKLGEEMGILFQLQDDMLNLYGLTRKTGKPVGSDIREGKKTLVYLYLYNHASAAERKKLDMLFGGKKLDNAATYIYKLLTKYHIREFVKEKSQKLATSSRTYIDKLHIDEKYAAGLRDTITYIMNRGE